MSDNPRQDPETGRFLPGNNGGPGRPKGSRNRLGEQFLDDLYDLWKDEGAKILKNARLEKPMEFARMVASLLPKELLIRRDPLDDMSEVELDERLDALEQFINAARSSGDTPRPTHTSKGRA